MVISEEEQTLLLILTSMYLILIVAILYVPTYFLGSAGAGELTGMLKLSIRFPAPNAVKTSLISIFNSTYRIEYFRENKEMRVHVEEGEVLYKYSYPKTCYINKS